MIAIAISCQPRLLIADEPTTALDVTVQAQILETLRRLIKDTQMSLLLITHDIGVISEICENVAVLYAGRTVESLPLSNFLNSPTSCHPYSEALLNSRVFQVDQRGRRLSAIPGSPPDPNTEFVGCSFAPRCSYTTQKCHDKNPELKIIAPTHLVRCWERK